MKYMPSNSSFENVVFVDRDGVLNQEPGPILSPEQFLWIPRSREAVLRVNQQGWLCLVVTNQSGFARGLLTRENFEAICDKMDNDLAEIGAHLDDLFYCPHHPVWEEGRVQELCHPCTCRKPGIGMFEQAAEQWNLTGKKAVFIGDNTTDYEAAAQWGIPSIGVKTGHAGKGGKISRSPAVWADDLFDAVSLLINHWPESSEE